MAGPAQLSNNSSFRVYNCFKYTQKQIDAINNVKSNFLVTRIRIVGIACTALLEGTFEFVRAPFYSPKLTSLSAPNANIPSRFPTTQRFIHKINSEKYFFLVTMAKVVQIAIVALFEGMIELFRKNPASKTELPEGDYPANDDFSSIPPSPAPGVPSKSVPSSLVETSASARSNLLDEIRNPKVRLRKADSAQQS